MPNDVTITDADEHLWRDFQSLAQRSYGHPVADITLLYRHADARVAVRGNRVIAGGLGVLVPQFFGGQPVPAACLACGCVAPEERGRQMWDRMIDERIHPLQEQGAVVATAWSTASGSGHRLGWGAPAQVFTWTVPTEQLRQSFADNTGFEIAHGALPQDYLVQRELAASWNGPWQRPDWWQGWQQDKHPGLAHYRFHRPGQNVEGLLALAIEHGPAHGAHLVVHDFWAASKEAAAAMFAFLGRYNGRIPTVVFQRTGLPPAPVLLSQLHRIGALAAEHWHPWMLRVLDVHQAVRLRGWPDDLDLTLPLELVTDAGDGTHCFTLRIAAGSGELEPSDRDGMVTLTRAQFAVWFAGGYRSQTAATLAGVRGKPQDVRRLVAATADREPWLPEHF
ncbi:GNAT family N-acetyltransferase [Saccharopolyspora taberi]|uniref:GNAT family N-acetyltransferase n=1 Tax=Saccharopolyspora taberi TaxID=60895 RepID=A0ABN3VF34_9PSEU